MVVVILFLVSCLTFFLPQEYQDLLAFNMNGQAHIQWLTSSLIHANVPHLAYNFALALLPAIVVQESVGAKATVRLWMMFSCLSILSHLVTTAALGASLLGFSGNTFGFMAYGSMVAGERRRYVLAFVLAISIASITLLEASRIGSFDMVAHAAHVGGAMAGFILYGLDKAKA